VDRRRKSVFNNYANPLLHKYANRSRWSTGHWSPLVNGFLTGLADFERLPIIDSKTGNIEAVAAVSELNFETGM